ncbi:MAG: hypothetical protein PHE84_00465 [bacterium]|nr:hypothetical protein [bacterium]
METNVANMSAKAGWAGLNEPSKIPSSTIIKTSLFEIIQAIDEAVNEDFPGSDWLVAEVFSDLLETGRIKLTGRLKDCRVKVVGRRPGECHEAFRRLGN